MPGAVLLALALAAQGDPAASAARAAWDGFPAFLWRLRHRGAEPPAALVAGFGGVDVKRGEDAAWADGLTVYLGHAPGRDDLHLDADAPAWREPWEEWVAAGAGRGELPDADELLTRRPCLRDPETAARLDATLARTLERHADRAPLFASLGDEVSLTPSQGVPWDGCRSPRCRAGWEARRGSGAPMPATDRVRRAWTAGETAELGAWLDLRRFHRGVVEDEVLRLAAEARRARPGLALGLLGTIGATPFGGVDLARLVPALDVVECYPEGDARADVETLRTLPDARPLRSLRTVFVAGDAPAGAAWQVSEHWVRGGDGVVVWCDGDVADRPEHAARLRAVLAEVRALEAAVGDHRPAPRGLAVLRDDDSRALVLLAEALLDGPTWPNRFPSHQAAHGRVEAAVAGWLRLAEDLGHHPGVVRFGGLDAVRFPVVVLPHVRVVGAAGAAELERFLAAGGVLLVEGELGTHDRDGVPRGADLAAALAERFPARVRAVAIGDYAARRLAWDPARRAARLPDAARAALEAAGHARDPLVGADGTPWLVARTRRAPEAGGGLLVCAVPNLVSPEERARLGDLRVPRPAPPPGHRIVWHQPAAPGGDDAVLVPAGSALVYELVPAR